MEKNIVLIIFLILIIGCQSTKDYQSDVKLTFSTDDNLAVKDLFEYKFIPLETCDSGLIGFMTKIDYFEDRIYILDFTTNRILVFDDSGKFISQIGQIGGGPGEYEVMLDFKINEHKRLIYTQTNNKKILCYDLGNYEFQYSINTPFEFKRFNFCGDGICWFDLKGITPSKEKDYFVVTDEDFNTQYTFYPTTFKTFYYMSLGLDNIYTVGNRTFAYHPLLTWIYEINKDEVVAYRELELKNATFAPIDYLKKITANGASYAGILEGSEYINTYAIF